VSRPNTYTIMAWDHWQRQVEIWWPRYWPSGDSVEVLTDEMYHKYMEFILDLDLATLAVSTMYAPPSRWIGQLIGHSVCRKSRPSPKSVEYMCEMLYTRVKLIPDNQYGRHLISIKEFQCFINTLLNANKTITALSVRWYNRGYYHVNDSFYGNDKCYLVRSVDTHKMISDELNNVRQTRNLSIVSISPLTGRLLVSWAKGSHQYEHEFEYRDKQWHSTSDASMVFNTTDELFVALEKPWTSFPEK
jgi:hypothetical protein